MCVSPTQPSLPVRIYQLVSKHSFFMPGSMSPLSLQPLSSHDRLGQNSDIAIEGVSHRRGPGNILEDRKEADGGSVGAVY